VADDVALNSLYTALVYFEWPLPIIAILLASLALGDNRSRNRVAWAAIIIGALSIFTLVAVFAALIFFTQGQSSGGKALAVRG